MRKQDIFLSFIIGLVVGVAIFFISRNLEREIPFAKFLPYFLPFLSAAGMATASWLSKKLSWLLQAARFILVGALNTVLDLGILNLLMFISGVTQGWPFTIFKSISFTTAMINSYFWNKLWTFQKRGGVRAGEFLVFLFVSAVGFGVNVGVASFLVNIIGPQSGLGPKIWANVGAILATALSMVWNFIGYKFFVFKSKPQN